MYRGINAITLDGKGRLAMPARYRAHFAGSAQSTWVVTIDTEETCLLMYPAQAWQVIEEKLQALPSFNPEARRIQRLLIGHATEIELDNNGRFLLPPLLREYASLEKKVMLIGQGNKFEIWEEALWLSKREQWLAQTPLSVETMPLEMQSLAL